MTRKIDPNRSLGHLRPDLAEEWSEKNEKTPFDYTVCNAREKVWWKCLKDPSHPDFDMLISNRTGTRNKQTCPYCSGKRVCKTNSFGYLFPELLEEWSELNKKTPYDYRPGTHTKVLWKCLKNCEHPDYEMGIASRTKKTGTKQSCPYCSSQRVCEANSLGRARPELIEEWSDRNDRSIFTYTEFSHSKVWWRCLANEDHPDYEMQISDRTKKGNNCPYCTNKRVCLANSLGTNYPDICIEWSELNEKTPYDYAPRTPKMVWWRCLVNEDHPDYEMRISDRTRADEKKRQGCPYCSGKKVCEVNSLAYLKPELCKEWSSENSTEPSQYTAGSGFYALWICKRGHEDYRARIIDRAGPLRQGCPVCNESTGEKRVKEYLKFLDFEYTREKKFDDCVDKARLRYDFYVELPVTDDAILPILIEYHGKQHYLPLEFFGGEEEFQHRQRRDQIKREYAKRNGMPLLEIRYDEEVCEAIDRFIERLDRSLMGKNK